MTYTITPLQKLTAEHPLVLFSWQDSGAFLIPKALPKALKIICDDTVSRKEFSGKLGESVFLHVAEDGKTWRVLLVGAGEKSKASRETLTRAVATAAAALTLRRYESVQVAIPRDWVKISRDARALGVLVAKGMGLGIYKFAAYQSNKEKPVPIETIILAFDGVIRLVDLRAGLAEGEVIAAATTLVRDWTNMPSNDATPAFLALQAGKIAKDFPKIACTVFDKAEIKKRGMGGVYGVSKGANEHPRFIILEYWGTVKTKPSIALCGKAVTFDSGGISIKPAEKMEEMKYDMAGGAAVIGAIRAIAALKLPTNVIGIIPATENLPGAEAYKPGDILRTLSGKTIEVVNTDAEGRVILSDALEYAKQYTPAFVVDIATLTGSVSVALGHQTTAVVGNNTAVISAVKKAAVTAGEAVWELPLLDEYHEYVKSDVADLKNITGRQGGVISGAAFLAAFAEPMHWAHLDIGGTAYTTEVKPWQVKGATGWGVHLFVELAKQFAKRKASLPRSLN